LIALGYREDQDFFLGIRFTQGDRSELPTAARDLVRQEVDLIFVDSDESVKPAQQATRQIPIVFASMASDPLRLGAIESFARPGGNVTGVADLALDLGPKRLQVFQELVPHLKRVLFPYNPVVDDAPRVRVYQDAAHLLGIELIAKPVRTEIEAQVTISQIKQGEVDGILAPYSITLNIPGFVLETGIQHGIPTMFNSAFFVERRGLASYGPDFYETGKQAARLVDKILKGANPAEIPVERISDTI
jgi:putative ABC transport system substrate-binding protein